MTTNETVLHDVTEHREGNVHTVTVNNPARLNVLNSATMTKLLGTMAVVADDERARVMLLRGSGERAWIGGADINEMANLDEQSAVAFIRRVHGVCEALRALPIPVVAAIRGYCLGAGLEVAASCDLRIAAHGSHYGMPEVRVGLPSVVEAALLPRLIGVGHARDLVMTARVIDAEQANAWGLLDGLAAPADFEPLIDERVGELLAAAPQAMRVQKRLCRSWDEKTLEASIEVSIEAFGASFRSDEPNRYLQQFLNRKR